MKRRELLESALTTGFAYAVVIPGIVLAQSESSLKLTVPFPPGGGGDVLARSSLDLIGKNADKNIWVANRPGAGGNIGITQMLEEKPDGGVFGYVTNGIMCVNPYLYKNQRFDPITDLIPAGQLSKIGLVMVLNPNALPGVTDFESLIKYAKEHPKDVFFASSGVGTTSHLAGEYLAQEAGLELTHVPHAGGAAAIVEVLAGRIPFMIDVAPNVLNHVKEGTLKALAVTSNERLEAFPEVPTLKELGLKDYELYAWDGYVFPKGTPEAYVAKMSEAISSLKDNPVAQERIKNLGATPVFSNSEEFSEYIRKEQPKFKKLVERITAQSHGGM
ncbi:MAG: tripartite tricarboxylate transporter substrate binding protein [Burkholderiales bacterium]|nr:tripartite tricarboxylate transporter substrate binding protein [Burkholderiales bacterium]